jgi:hypothetical protein
LRYFLESMRQWRYCGAFYEGREEPHKLRIDQGKGRPLPIFRVAVRDAAILGASVREGGSASNTHSVGFLSFLLFRLLRN